MKILLSFAFIFVFAVNNIFAAPLVFKTTKEMKESGDMLTFDASKYKKVRVGVFLSNPPIYKNEYESSFVRLFSVEGEDSIYVGVIEVGRGLRSGDFLIDTPAPKIKLTALTAGTYRIYIWAE